MQQALDFLRDHKEIALATCEGNLPKLRLFQIMKQEGTHLYFATSPEKAAFRSCRRILPVCRSMQSSMLLTPRCWTTYRLSM